ncbi:MAG: NUDIX hydrolase, partial [Solirubrobacteraceae bacterium]
VHYWNRLPDGVEVDLTREQFCCGEEIGEPTVVRRPDDVTRGRLAGQYHLLAAAAARELTAPLGPVRPSRPVSVKGVCLDSGGRVLLCRNRRAEWELPGGRPAVGERFDSCVQRELREETGLAASADSVIAAYPFEVTSGAWLDIVVHGCHLDASRPPMVSDEHERVAFLDPEALGAGELPAGYARAITRWRGR